MSVRFVLSVIASYGGGIKETNIWGGCYQSFDESNTLLHETP